MIVKIQDFGGIMNVSVSQPNLAQALSIVSHAVSSRSTLTILENILITTEQDRICLAATNLELGLRYWIPAQIEQEGSITVPARMFTDLVNTMPADTVNLQLNEINDVLTKLFEQVESAGSELVLEGKPEGHKVIVMRGKKANV